MISNKSDKPKEQKNDCNSIQNVTHSKLIANEIARTTPKNMPALYILMIVPVNARSFNGRHGNRQLWLFLRPPCQPAEKFAFMYGEFYSPRKLLRAIDSSR